MRHVLLSGVVLAAAGALAVRQLASMQGQGGALDEPAPLDNLPDTAGPIDPAPLDLAPGVDSAPAVNVLGFPVPRLTWQLPARAAPFAETIARAEVANALPAGLLGRLIQQESNFNPAAVNPSSGAQGIAQFMPATARDLGVDPFNASSAINGAARYLRQLFDRLGSWPQALAAYNWGIGNVTRRGMAAAPAETRAYVADITGDLGLS